MMHGSAAETFGLGVAEALCSGLPVIAPSVGGAADLVTDNSGVFYEPGDHKECALQALELLERPREALVKGCAEAEARINTVERHFEQLFDVYGQLCAGRNAPTASDEG